ncbi:MAG: transcription termination/antitermination protein NusA [Gammaproteobacteria bacterium AqS3]|nr:transcription termination/antitermination protein NusA [Gammaproteobacteria bacterium AqS3]
MDNELEILADMVAAERDLPRDSVVRAIEDGLSEAARQHYGGDARERETGIEVRVRFTNARLTEYETFRVWTVVASEEEVEDAERQVTVEQARSDNPEIQIGEQLREDLKNIGDTRISARRTKQMWMRKIREAVSEQIAQRYRNQVGELLSGEVKRVTDEVILVELSTGVEARLPRSNALSGDKYKIGDQVRAVLEIIDEKSSGQQLLLTRQGTDIIKHLFHLEVPEIADGTVEICGVAREPGVRSKVAVRSGDGRVDAVGACIGARGVRVQTVTDELAQERIDIVPWDENVTQYVINSMSLPQTARIFVDENSRSMDITIEEQDLGHAIGKYGQNVRLSSELCGWKLNVMTADELRSKMERNRQGPRELFMKGLNIDDNMADILFNEGFYTLEDIRDTPIESLAGIEGIGADLAKELAKRVRRTLVLIARGDESVRDLIGSAPAQELLDLDNMETATAYALAKHGISTLEDLAEQSTYDLQDLELEGFKESIADSWIIAARRKLSEAAAAAEPVGEGVN